MSREIRIEALRLAREIIKHCIREQGSKICCYTRREIDEAARRVVAGRPIIVQNAWDNCKMRWEAAREAEREGHSQ